MSKKYCIIQFRDGKFGVRSQNKGWDRIVSGKEVKFLSKDFNWEEERYSRYNSDYQYDSVDEAQSQLDAELVRKAEFDAWWKQHKDEIMYRYYVPDNGTVINCSEQK